MVEERYAKQINFRGIGLEGQKLLKKARVLIVGCGALGTVVANSLARTGVGYLRIVDRDFVELSNLHRQILFNEADAANSVPKAEAAREALLKANSGIEIEAVIKDVNSITIEGLAGDMDIIVDCTDNFKTRYLINDVAFLKGIPWIYGGAVGSTGVVKSYIPGETGCLRCLMEVPPPTGSIATCDTAGVINMITGIVGMYQSSEVIKYLTDNKDLMNKSMLFIDLWDNVFESVEVGKKEDCPCCQQRKFQYLEDKMPEAVHICGSNSVQVDPGSSKKIQLKQLHERLQAAGIAVRLTPFILNISAEGYEIKVFDDGRAIIKNAKTVEEGKVVYAKYIGY